MRRRDFLRTAGAAAVALVLDISALEGAQGSRRRAIRAALDPKGGWVLLKANAAGELTIKVRLNHGHPDTTYDVSVYRVFVDDDDLLLTDGELPTDERGKGTVSLSVDGYGAGETITVQVFLTMP
ncbi:MAG: twin-arginine translocation signal domain-containing protein [Phycisphaerales bacterium]|nr:MAG: twin-arginine translocation signal domain-containing protein [Phycisphaerales bacterium]